MGKRYWDDLTEGERFTCRPVAFDREGIVAFGKRYDPLPFHADEAAAARSIFGDVLTVEGRWDGLRRSRSKPDRGIAGLRCTVRNQRGETVMDYGYRYLVACRPNV